MSVGNPKVEAAGPDRFVRYKDLAPEHGIRISPPWLRKLVKEGRFPQPIALSPHRLGWLLSDIERYKQTRPPWQAAQRQPEGFKAEAEAKKANAKARRAKAAA